jgi:hypothetical protein
MSIFFGILFMLGGLALAVLLGIVLYRDPKKEARPRVGLANGEGAEAAQG